MKRDSNTSINCFYHKISYYFIKIQTFFSIITKQNQIILFLKTKSQINTIISDYFDEKQN